MNHIADCLYKITADIQLSAQNSGRAPPRLIAVSKGHPIAAAEQALRAGQYLFGENRVQEASQKFPPLRYSFPSLELHLIGALQTNKIKQALSVFDVIHTLDRESLALELVKHRDLLAQKKLLIQVNTGSEPQKSGVLPNEADIFIEQCLNRHRLPVVGLMTIPPADQDPAPHFSLLARLAEKHGLRELSMGMSADFETAIAHGATYVRIGTAIFGKRD